MKKRIGSLLLILALCFTLLPTAAFAADSTAAWDGTADTSWYTDHKTDTEYHFTTAEQLADTMIDVEAIVPGGVLCLFSAWNVHGLTTSLPQAYHVAVKRGRKITLPTFPKIELHHITDTMFDIGVEELVASGYHIHIYNKERCVCDAVKYRNKIGMDVCSEVVNNYISQPDRNLSLLMDYADKLRVKRILEQYIAIKL